LIPSGTILILIISLEVCNKKILSQYRISPEISTIIAGDSRAQAYDDQIIEASKNISQGSESMMYTYFKLKALLQSNPQINKIYLGVSYHSFAAYYDDFTFKSDVASNYLFILPIKLQFSLLSDYRSNNYQLISKSLIKSLINCFGLKSNLSFIGKSFTYTSNIKLNKKDVLATIDKMYFEKLQYRDFSLINIEYFGLIIDLCKTNGVSFVILNPPTYYLHDQNIPQNFKDKYTQLMNLNSVKVINFDNLLNQDLYYMPDGIHINKQGSENISKYLNEVQRNEISTKTSCLILRCKN
jgi:hypothetical protein